MKLKEILDALYEEQVKQQAELDCWHAANPATRGEYKGFTVNYAKFTKLAIDWLQEEYPFTEKQARYIFSRSEEFYHAHFASVIEGAAKLADVVIHFV